MKIETEALNCFGPQALYAYGTYGEDGAPNFGLFSWLSGCFDGEMGVTVCLSGDKMTKDRIRATNVFSANLITEELLPLADYMGFTEGYSGSKLEVPVETERGRVLDVPILAKSPWVYELEVHRSVELDGGEVFFCRIRNALADEVLCDEALTLQQRMGIIRPAYSVRQTYFNWDGTAAGDWKTLMGTVERSVPG